MTFQKQISFSNTSTNKEIENGLEFLLSHIGAIDFPRTIMTKKLGYQIIVYSKEEALARYKQYNFVDCRINAFPSLKEGVKWIPELLFINLDNNNFETDRGLESALYNTLKNIKDQLGDRAIPTVLRTGGGYHIILPVSCPTALENITEFQEFDKPSEQFLRFAKDFLSNGNADPNNNPSFKSCLLRIPGSINSKYGNKVIIVQKWNGFRPRLSLELMLDFKRLLKQKSRQIEFDSISSRRNRSNDTNNNYSHYYEWIEKLLQIPIKECRKRALWQVLCPYLVNVKKLSNNESYQILNEWLDKCNSLERLDFNPDQKIRYELKRVGNYYPLGVQKLKNDNQFNELYQLLKKENIL